MDGDAVRQSESALRKENAALKAELAAVPQPAGTELVAVAGSGDAAAARRAALLRQRGGRRAGELPRYRCQSSGSQRRHPNVSSWLSLAQP